GGVALPGWLVLLCSCSPVLPRPRRRSLCPYTARFRSGDGGTLTGNPDLGFLAGIVGVVAILPFPSQAARLGGIVSEHTAIERVHRAPVVGPVSIDFCHRYASAFASTYSMLLMSGFWVNGLRVSHVPSRRGSRRTVCVSCSSSRTIRKPAAAIWLLSRRTVTSSSRSSC